jgi:hypothetical protein
VSEHLTSQSIERFRNKLMSPMELLQAGDHFAVCSACREQAAGDVATGRLFNSFNADLKRAVAEEASAHLTYEQTAAFVDQRLDDVEREIANSHLQLCHECAEDVRDLSAFRATLNRETEQRKDAAIKTTPTAQTVSTEKLDQPRGAHAFWQRLRPLGALAFALLIVTILVSLYLLSRPRRTQGPLVVQSNPTPLNPPVSPTVSTSPSIMPAPASASPTIGPTPPLMTNSRSGKTNSATVTPAPSTAETRIALRDNNGRVTINDEGRIAGLSSLAPDEERAMRDALNKGALQAPASLRQLNGEAETLLGGSNQEVAFSLLSPVGTIVRSDRPGLRWQPLEGASNYTVAVFDSDFNRVAQSPPLSTAEWVLPQGLRRGVMYRWQVTAIKDGKEIVAPVAPAPEARFRILDQPALDHLTHAEEGNRNSHLVRGVLAAQAGLLDDAEQEFKALLAANPRSAVARKLLRNVRRLRAPR